MSKNKRSSHSKHSNFKKFCYENLWVLALFAPLIVIAVLVMQNFELGGKQTIKIKKSRSIATVAIEITSAELATIIAKPLSELLLIEVYFNGKNKVRNKRAVLEEDIESSFINQKYNEAIADQLEYKGKAGAVFSQLPKSLKDKKLGEHT